MADPATAAPSLVQERDVTAALAEFHTLWESLATHEQCRVVLFLPPTIRGRDAITERDLRPIAAVADWGRQRRMWRRTPGK